MTDAWKPSSWLAAIALLLSPQAVTAETSNWINPGTSSWFIPSNWSTGSVPTASTFSFVDGGTAFIPSGTARSDQFVVGFSAPGAVRIDSGATLAVAGSVIGHGAGVTATVDVLGGTWTETLNSDSMWIGNNGTGIVNLRDNGTISLQGGNSWIALGHGATGVGTLNIGAPSGSAAVAPGRINGTQVTTGAGTGTVVLNHTSSSYYLTKTGAIGGAAVALNGSLNLLVENGTTVLTGTAAHTGGTTFKGGTLRVEGGALGVSTNSLTVANASGESGTLVLSGGGTATGQLGTIGFGSGSNGTAVITGSGSEWSTTNNGLPFVIGRSGTGTLTLTDAGRLTVFGSSGDVNLGALASGNGTLNFGAPAGSAPAAPGILNANSVYKGNGTGKIVFNHTGNDYFLTKTGATGGTDIPLSGGLSIQHSSGTTTLRGASTYTGATTITGGRLFAGSNSAFGSSAIAIDGANATLGYRPNVTLANTVTLRAGGKLEVLAGSTATQSGIIGESGGSFGFTKVGAGTLVLSGANTYTGTTTLSEGILDIRHNAALGSGTLVVTGANAQLAYTTAAASVGNDITLQANLSITTPSESGGLTLTGDIGESGGSFGLTIPGTASDGLTLSGTNSYSGGTELVSGRLVLVSDTGLGAPSGALRVRNGTLAITGDSSTTRELQFGNGTTASSSATIEVAAGKTYATSSAVALDPVSNDASRTLTKAGSGTLLVGGITGGLGNLDMKVIVAGGTLITTGGVEIGAVSLLDGATLQFGNGGAATSSSPLLSIGSDDDSSGNVVFDHTESDFHAGTLSGDLHVAHTGDGTTTLNPGNSYTGGTEIAGGTVVSHSMDGTSGLGTGAITVGLDGTLLAAGEILGDIAVSGMLALDDPIGSQLVFNKDLTLGSTATIVVRLGDDIGDSLHVNGDLTFGGTLSLDFDEGWTPDSGDSFEIFSFEESHSGTFVHIAFSNPGFTGTFDYATGVLTVVAVPEPSACALGLVGLLAALCFTRRNRTHRKSEKPR